MHKEILPVCGIETLREGGPSSIKNPGRTTNLQSILDSACGKHLNLILKTIKQA